MPHLTLHRKAFIALAGLLVALLLIFAGFSRLGLQRGLGPYVAEIELARMDWLAERLQAHHTQTGGWDTLRNQPRLWGQLSHPGSGLRRSNTQGAEGTPPTDRSGSSGMPPELANGNPAADRSMQQPPPPPPDGGPPPGERGAGGPQRHPDDLFPRLGLVDAQQHLVAGTAPQPGGARLALTGADGKTIDIPGRGMSVTISGVPANGDTFRIGESESSLSIFDSLDRTIAALSSQNATGGVVKQAVNTGMTEIDSVLSNVQSARSAVGESLNRMEGIESRIGALKLAAETERSNAEDLDMVEAISRFQNQQTGYQAALQSYAAVQKLSLFQYLNV